MALLNQTPQPMPEEMPEEAPEQMPEQMPEEGAPEEGSGGLTVTADAVAEKIKESMDPDMWDDVKQAVREGMKLMFEKKSHDLLFDSIRPEDEVPLEEELGTGATNFMMIMYHNSQGTMPLEVVGTAGTILLAKACEFINETGMAPIDDDVFAEALEIFSANIQDKLNPDFRAEKGLEPSAAPTEGTPSDLPASGAAAPVPPNGGGLLAQGGMQ